MPRLAIVFLILIVCADGTRAQAPDSNAAARVVSRRAAAGASREAERQRRRPDYLSGSNIAEEAHDLAARQGMGTTLLTSSDDQTTYLLVRRRTASRPEVHARWDDLVIVRAGVGAIEMGDSLVGSTYRAPGERVGGTIAKSYRIVVHAGDMLRIPAAVPHAFIVSGFEPLEYLVIKQRQQRLPIRWVGEK
jgi:mannose-6-phosphate isomerase-like protein (cupin superfamily)